MTAGIVVVILIAVLGEVVVLPFDDQRTTAHPAAAGTSVGGFPEGEHDHHDDDDTDNEDTDDNLHDGAPARLRL